MKPRPTDPPARQLGSIHRDEAYPLPVFGSRMNLGTRALADAQKKGLRTIMFGRNKYVLGSDAIAWLQSLAQQAQQQGGDGPQ